jgi:hypothetical protein
VARYLWREHLFPAWYHAFQVMGSLKRLHCVLGTANVMQNHVYLLSNKNSYLQNLWTFDIMAPWPAALSSTTLQMCHDDCLLLTYVLGDHVLGTSLSTLLESNIEICLASNMLHYTETTSPRTYRRGDTVPRYE